MSPSIVIEQSCIPLYLWTFVYLGMFPVIYQPCSVPVVADIQFDQNYGKSEIISHGGSGGIIRLAFVYNRPDLSTSRRHTNGHVRSV